MPTWPSSLPACPVNRSLSWAPVPNVVETPNDVGDVIVRRRFTGTTIIESGMLVLTQAQCQTLFEFWGADCAQGAVAFQMVSWRDQITRDYQFMGTAPPQFAAMSTRFSCNLQLRYTITLPGDGVGMRSLLRRPGAKPV
jgi:hypothetical protein